MGFAEAHYLILSPVWNIRYFNNGPAGNVLSAFHTMPLCHKLQISTGGIDYCLQYLQETIPEELFSNIILAV